MRHSDAGDGADHALATAELRLSPDRRGQGPGLCHPLVSGDPETVHRTEISVRGRTVPEVDDDELEDYIVDWLP